MLNEIKDRYQLRIEREIAKGGMGTIYEATQLGTNGFEKKVAIKTLLPSLSRNPRFVEMFIGEGRLVADLVHENIVQIYQLGNTRGSYYIVMEYVHGLSLHEFIRYHAATGLTVPRELAVFITSRIARGLAYAHSRLNEQGRPLNIVHRDVCPTNILITTEGLPKLADFGIAKAATVMPAHERVLMGKLFYMSPQQARREPVNHASDIYSLGMVMYELLTLQKARQPWAKDILAAARDGLANWDGLPDDMAPGISEILHRMLAADLDERYSDTNEVGYDLEYFIYHKGYGPTVVTLENYMREHFAFLYNRENVPRKPPHTATATSTVVMPTTELGD